MCGVIVIKWLKGFKVLMLRTVSHIIGYWLLYLVRSCSTTLIGLTTSNKAFHTSLAIMNKLCRLSQSGLLEYTTSQCVNIAFQDKYAYLFT